MSEFEAADPAAVYVEGGGRAVQVYATNGWTDRGTWANVLTFSAVPGRPVTGSRIDALPSLPPWVEVNPLDDRTLVWAPTVRLVAGRYLMLFGGSRVDGAMCIGAATSPTPQGPFTPTKVKWCDPQPDVGWLDPQLFVAPSGRVFAYWSRQWAPAGGSEILVQELTPDGLAGVGRPTRVVGYDDVAPYAPDGGAHAYVENPSVVKDPFNGYDLLVSIGTWSDASYRTFQMPCLTRVGYCVPRRGITLPLAVAGAEGAGGASLVSDATPAGNLLYFAARPSAGSARRVVHSARTSACVRSVIRAPAAAETAPCTVPVNDEGLSEAIRPAWPEKVDAGRGWHRPERARRALGPAG